MKPTDETYCCALHVMKPILILRSLTYMASFITWR